MELKPNRLQIVVIVLGGWAVSAFSGQCFNTATNDGRIQYSNPLLQLHINNVYLHWNTSDTTTAQLAHKYTTYCESLDTFTENSSFVFTLCYSNDSCRDNNSHSITFNFTSHLDTSTWQLSAVNYTYGNTSLLSCSQLSPAVLAKDWAGSGFYCGNVSCSQACGEVQLQQMWVQAFGSVSKVSSFLDCGRSSSNNLVVDLVVGAAVGGSVAMAAVVIVMRFLYRRCWYGKYNLLNE